MICKGWDSRLLDLEGRRVWICFLFFWFSTIDLDGRVWVYVRGTWHLRTNALSSSITWLLVNAFISIIGECLKCYQGPVKIIETIPNHSLYLSYRLLGEVQSPECVTTSTTAVVRPTTPTPTTTSSTTTLSSTTRSTTARMTTEKTKDFKISLLDSHNVPTQNALSEELLIGGFAKDKKNNLINIIMFQVW